MPVLSKKGALDGEFIKSSTNTCKIKKFILIQNILGCYTKKVFLNIFRVQSNG